MVCICGVDLCLTRLSIFFKIMAAACDKKWIEMDAVEQVAISGWSLMVEGLG